MQEEFREKERLEKVAEATEFIRDTLKEAAPRVARNYVFHVSTEANQMFREITGNAERTLKWAEDYGIMLEEGGYDRPFVSLSGGEQMSAALAVRLALLKQLSDVRIAFFDEPTANLDADRRERLAEEVSRITERQTFDQLFVISHDDTFESYVDHIVEVGKD
jgi:exonuclease SbcC